MNKQELIKQITDKVAESVPITKKTVISQTHSDKYTRLVKVETRDITLEDVLIALEKARPKVWNVAGNGDVWNNSINADDEDWTNWQLGKPLHEQSEECLEFIWQILK